jgi:hypothetical protein
MTRQEVWDRVREGTPYRPCKDHTAFRSQSESPGKYSRPHEGLARLTLEPRIQCYELTLGRKGSPPPKTDQNDSNGDS